MCCLYFFFNESATPEIYTYWHTLSLHDALPILLREVVLQVGRWREGAVLARRFDVVELIGAAEHERRDRHRGQPGAEQLRLDVLCLQEVLQRPALVP